MKSIICSFLFLSTTLCLFPFVAFSSTTFTSTNNPILLPTTTDDNGILLPEVLDMYGQPLKIDEEYIIHSPLPGGGTVYVANTVNNTCPNAVVQHILARGLPVKFLTEQPAGVVREMDDINIMFSVIFPNSCVNETVWKVDDTRFVVIGAPERRSNWFKIEKVIMPEGRGSYKLRYCPSQFMCPTCPIVCSDVGVISDSGYNRLALTDRPIPYGFEKVRKTDHA